MRIARIFRPLLRLLGHQDYIKFPLRKRWISKFHHPETARDETFLVDFHGYEYRGNFNSTLDWDVYYFGTYAREEMHLLRDILGCFDRPVMFDVGGNCGHHALYLSRYAEIIHTFEPFPPLAEKINEKIDTNSVANIVVHNMALGEEAAILPYYPPHDNHIGLGSFSVKTGASPVELQVVRADDLFPGTELDRLNLLKLDIEGFEVHALKGMRGLLDRHRPVIFIEWSEATRDALGDAEFSGLFPEGYRCFVFIDNAWKPRLRAFRQPGYDLDPVAGEPPLANLLVVPEAFIERCRKSRKLVTLWDDQASR